MATATAPVGSKRKREDVNSHSTKAKRVAVEPEQYVGSEQRFTPYGTNAMTPKTHSNIKPAPGPRPPIDSKRLDTDLVPKVQAEANEVREPTSATQVATKLDEDIYIHIVTGSYERVLHGIAAKVPRRVLAEKVHANGSSNGASENDAVTFSDTFLFAAHASSVRCLAISPATESDKRYLATGSSDERINVYSISTAPPTNDRRVDLPKMASSTIAERPTKPLVGQPHPP